MPVGVLVPVIVYTACADSLPLSPLTAATDTIAHAAVVNAAATVAATTTTLAIVSPYPTLQRTLGRTTTRWTPTLNPS